MKNAQMSPSLARPRSSSRLWFALLASTLMLAPAAAQSQNGELPPEARGPTTRQELTQSLSAWDSLASQGYGHAAREATAIRRRLTDGDFRTGDRIVLTILNSSEYPVDLVAPFRDTLTVIEGGTLMLPLAGAVSVRGLLRPELDAHLTRELSQVFRDPPRIVTSTTIPVGVSGAVGRQGFFSYPPSARVQEVIMHSGPSGNADLNRIVVKRNRRDIVSADSLRVEIARGATLEQLDIRAGDEFAVAERKPPFRWTSLLGIASTVLGLVWAADRVFGNRR